MYASNQDRPLFCLFCFSLSRAYRTWYQSAVRRRQIFFLGLPCDAAALQRRHLTLRRHRHPAVVLPRACPSSHRACVLRWYRASSYRACARPSHLAWSTHLTLHRRVLPLRLPSHLTLHRRVPPIVLPMPFRCSRAAVASPGGFLFPARLSRSAVASRVAPKVPLLPLLSSPVPLLSCRGCLARRFFFLPGYRDLPWWYR